MSTPKYKLLVLTDLSKACNIALENAVNLSKTIGGSIDVFHVMKSSDIAEYENQFSTMRSIDEERVNKKSQLKEIAKEIAEKSNITIRTHCILGNLKDEATEYIEAVNPDIIVLGKRTKKLANFLGDGFTKFILNSFEGSVLISGKEKALQPSEGMSLGMLNTTVDELPAVITNDLRKNNKSPMKRFHIRNEKEQMMQEANAENVITYEFENDSNTMNNIAKYVAKNNIGLLCINPHEKKSSGPLFNIQSNIKEVIQKINAPILIINNKSSIQLQ